MSYYETEVLEIPLVPTDTKLKSEVISVSIIKEYGFEHNQVNLIHEVIEEGIYKGATAKHQLKLNCKKSKRAIKDRKYFELYDKLTDYQLKAFDEAGQSVMKENILMSVFGGLQLLSTYNLYDIDDDGKNVGNNISDIEAWVDTEETAQQQAINQPNAPAIELDPVPMGTTQPQESVDPDDVPF